MTEPTFVPEDWERALAVVAHPDDLEYGVASAVARWTDQGKEVRYCLVTSGEAGIDSMPPDECAKVRQEEERRSAAVVGVDEVEFLGHPDGLVMADLVLRRDLAMAIRRFRPDVVVSINFATGSRGWTASTRRPPPHRHSLGACADAASRWLWPGAGGDAWGGVRFALFGNSPEATHVVDVTDWIDRAWRRSRSTGPTSARCPRARPAPTRTGSSGASPRAWASPSASPPRSPSRSSRSEVPSTPLAALAPLRERGGVGGALAPLRERGGWVSGALAPLGNATMVERVERQRNEVEPASSVAELLAEPRRQARHPAATASSTVSEPHLGLGAVVPLAAGHVVLHRAPVALDQPGAAAAVPVRRR